MGTILTITRINAYCGKVGAKGKSPFPNADNVVGYGYAGKAATGKSSPTNAGNTVRYGYAGKAAAIGKSLHPNAGNTVGYGYADKVVTTVKSPLPNTAYCTAGKVNVYVFVRVC